MQPLLQWKSEKALHDLCVCICSPRYPACNAHAPYCYLWTAPLYIFPHYLIKARFSKKKKVIEHKMCFLISSTTLVWNLSRSKKYWARYDKKMSSALHVKYRLFLSDFNETNFLEFFFGKYSYQIQWKSVQWQQSFMRTDRRTWS